MSAIATSRESIMTFNTIEFVIEKGVATITLNRPDCLNSFTDEMHAELREALAKVTASAEVRCVLLTGRGRGFCAGQDLAVVAASVESIDLEAAIADDWFCGTRFKADQLEISQFSGSLISADSNFISSGGISFFS